ncbi:YdcF family protein [Pistricoccus aurantiacus]|uniref:YdcF family protein n=1 Tax=Pistricoccus aurantiacus TaxID=1883414 RepID=UPI003626F02B
MSFLKYLLLPPQINILLILAGILLWRRFPTLSGLAIVLSTLSLLVLALPWTSYWLRQSLEPPQPPSQEELAKAQAIVILGGGRDVSAPEFDWGDAPNNATWRRLVYGAKLYRDTGLPILVTGGADQRYERPEAELMANALEQVFNIPVKWRESESRTTAENATYSARILDRADIGTIALVSQAWHLPRAIPEFTQVGLKVIPAPTEFASPPPSGIAGWVPRAYYLRSSSIALHEWLGRGYYRLRHRMDENTRTD